MIRKATAIPITISAQHTQNKNKLLNKKEMQALRSVIGQISWLAGISLPDLSFEKCVLSTSQTRTTEKRAYSNK